MELGAGALVLTGVDTKLLSFKWLLFLRHRSLSLDKPIRQPKPPIIVILIPSSRRQNSRRLYVRSSTKRITSDLHSPSPKSKSYLRVSLIVSLSEEI